MPLSDDQRALLQILVTRGKDPEEISLLLGIDRSELDSRICDAVRSLAPGQEEIPSEVALFLVGQADPMTRADAATMLDSDPDLVSWFEKAKEALATELTDQPDLPRDRAPSRRTSRSDRTTPPLIASDAGQGVSGNRTAIEAESESETRAKMDPSQRRLLSVLISAVGLLSVVGAVVVLTGGRDEAPAPPGATKARLVPVGKNRGSGELEFGRAGGGFAIRTSVTGLEESRRGETYVFWLVGPTGAEPIVKEKADASGTIQGVAGVAPLLICAAANDEYTDVKVSKTLDRNLARSLRAGSNARAGRSTPYVGETVLRGQISLPQSEKRSLLRDCARLISQIGSQGS